MQRDLMDHEQIIYESSNRRMKQLMDWLSSRVTRVAVAGCHSVGVAAAEEYGLEVKQVCWLAGFEVIRT